MKFVSSLSSPIKEESPIVVALNYSSRDQALSFIDQIEPQDCHFKIGTEMFTRFGPKIILDLHQRGFNVFLDLKFYDIPNVVSRSIVAAADLGVWMINVHALSGENTMISAREALLPYGKDAPLLIAVTVLTSIESKHLKNFGINLSLYQYAERLAQLTHNCGLDGVVCSAKEAVYFRDKFGKKFKLVTPGIRLPGSDAYDQRRIMTPLQAKKSGADYIVIGRPITQSDSPVQTLKEILSIISNSNHVDQEVI